MKSKIRLYGFGDNDRKVFWSLLSILSHKTAKEWIIADDWDVDIVVIDIDCDLQHLKINKLKSTGRNVIVFGDYDKIKSFNNTLHRPLRAAEILQCLQSVDGNHSSSAPNESNNINKLYRLKRWPPKTVLANVNHSSRLCAALLQRPISSEHLAKTVNLPLGDVEMFISSCHECGCIQITHAAETIPTLETKNNNIALFDRIRQKFRVSTSRG